MSPQPSTSMENGANLGGACPAASSSEAVSGLTAREDAETQFCPRSGSAPLSQGPDSPMPLADVGVTEEPRADDDLSGKKGQHGSSPSALNDEVNSPSMKDCNAPATSSCSSLEARVMARIDVIEKAVENVRQMAGQIVRDVQGRPPVGNANDRGQPADAGVLFRSGRSVASLQAASEQHLVPDPSRNVIYCDVCVDDVERSLDMKSVPEAHTTYSRRSLV